MSKNIEISLLNCSLLGKKLPYFLSPNLKVHNHYNVDDGKILLSTAIEIHDCVKNAQVFDIAQIIEMFV